VAPYTKLPLIYDEVMAHVDYNLWAEYSKKIIRKLGEKPRRFLDISCGTGSFLLSFYEAGHLYFGCDFSLEMLRIAKTKTQQKTIRLFQADMTSFSVSKEMDVIFCLYDSINYLNSFALWKKTFACVHNALRAKGLFVFDICTELNSIEYFDGMVEKNTGRGYKYIRESFFDRNRRIHHNKFFINFAGDSIEYIEDHQQTIYRVSDVIALIESSPFEFVGAYDGFTFQPGDENSLRVHFVLRKR